MRGNEEQKEGSIVAEVERWEQRAVGAADFVFVDVLFVKMLLVKSRNRATIDTRYTVAVQRNSIHVMNLLLQGYTLSSYIACGLEY